MNTKQRIRSAAIAILIGLTLAPSLAAAQAATRYFPITPCRVFNSLDGAGVPLVGGDLPGRSVTIKGSCGIPTDATALSYNVTIVRPSARGFLTLYPTDAPLPVVSSINFQAGDVRGNGGVVPLSPGESGDLTIYLATAPQGAAGHVIIDASGYFKAVAP